MHTDNIWVQPFILAALFTLGSLMVYGFGGAFEMFICIYEAGQQDM